MRVGRSGQLDESRLLPSAEKRARDVVKKLNRLAARQGWHTFMAGQAYAVATGKAPAKRNAEVMAARSSRCASPHHVSGRHTRQPSPVPVLSGSAGQHSTQ